MARAQAEVSALLQQAIAHQDRGAFAEAAQACAAALRLDPGHADTLYVMGVNDWLRGHRADALRRLDEAITAAPGHARAHAFKGAVLLAIGRAADAVRPLRRALSLAPALADAQMHLGLALDALEGKRAEAIAALDQATRLAPANADAWFNLANVLRKDGRLAEAVAAFRQSCALNPPLLDAWNNLGIALRDAGRRDEAILAWRQGLAYAAVADKAAAPLWSNLGNLLTRPDEVALRLESHRRAVSLMPDEARYHLNYAVALQEADKQGLAWVHIGRAYDLDPALMERHQPELGLNRASDEARLIAFRRAEGLKLAAAVALDLRPHANTREPFRRLRVGYLSPDFRTSPVAYFIEPVLAAHDPATFETFCYASVDAPDRVTDRFKAAAHNWRDVAGVHDLALAEQVRADHIDILIDLAGQTKGTRLGVIARRPAPVQATWIGSPLSTGLTSVDWRLVDAITDPPGMTEAHNTERLYRLPRGFLCYRPPDAAPAVSPPPMVARGTVTFGSFNFVGKIGSEVIAAWAAILKRVPGARLLLKHLDYDEPLVRAEILRQFAACGVAKERIEMRHWAQDKAAHLAAYGDMDIALDTYPYNGTTTTCEALWMGVPVVAVAGARHMARVSASLLTRVGLPELIAPTTEAYADVAVGLAGAPERLAGLRAGMRERLAASPLLDAAAFTRELEDAYRTMWREWCGR